MLARLGTPRLCEMVTDAGGMQGEASDPGQQGDVGSLFHRRYAVQGQGLAAGVRSDGGE
ncbi:MAG: hypothetical protein ACYSOV_07105 [Planctomycetota bacterium]